MNKEIRGRLQTREVKFLRAMKGQISKDRVRRT